MKILKHFWIILIIANLQMGAQQTIDRVEPSNWWVGMQNPALQLMVYGKDIGSLTPSISYPGVKIDKVTTPENSNYLFIDLIIQKKAKPGSFEIQFSQGKKKVLSHEYSLWKREAGSRDRQGFDQSDVLYLIMPDRFANGDPDNDQFAGMKEPKNRRAKGGRHGGDIEGIRKNLDYFNEMGFTALWLSPLLENDMPEYSYHGYSTTDFYKVDQRFGSNESYLQLCKEAKAKGIKMIMDMIVNHCGSEHWWMKDLPMDDWINQWDTYTETNHRKTLLQDLYASEADKKVLSDGWFVPTMPDLNQNNPFMATYLTQNTIWWIEYTGIDGVRMDTYPYPDMYYMSDWTKAVMSEYPNFNIVGEEWFESPVIVSYWQKGKVNRNGYTSELRSLMDFPVQTALVKALNEPEEFKAGWITLYEMIAMDFLYPNPEELVVLADNHDMSRILTQLDDDQDLLKLAIAFLMTTRGIPQIFYGTEILFANPTSDDHGTIRKDFPGGWKRDKVNAFTGKGLSTDQLEMQEFFRKLMHWRKTSTAVHSGKLLHFLPEDGLYVYFRLHEEQNVMVILSKNKKVVDLDLTRFAEVLESIHLGKNALTGDAIDLTKPIKVPAKSSLIIEMK